jgi:cytochrome c-type biogenesis protein CcmE
VKRGRTLFAVTVLGASLGWVALGGLRNSLVYYRTPTEVVQQGKAVVGERMRLGGLVVAGTVHRAGSEIRFVVTDGTTQIPVVDTANAPALFGERKGVVLEGTYGADGVFHADTMLVKHDDTYRPPAMASGASVAAAAGGS